MTRTEIINYLIKKINAKSYLEIGVREPEGNYNFIICENKTAVDPVPLSPGIIALTSDNFFAQNKDTFDIIFIDGLHEADQVERDIINSLAVLNPGGYILCHDMNPTDELMQRVPAETTGAWTGDCWKAWVKLRSERKDLAMFVLDTDYGVGIIQKGKQKLILLNGLELTYSNLVANRKEWLNLINSNMLYEL
jgi:hypothetical protein